MAPHQNMKLKQLLPLAWVALAAMATAQDTAQEGTESEARCPL